MLFDDEDDDLDDRISPIKPIGRINRDTRTNGAAFAQALRANIQAQRLKDKEAGSIFRDPQIRKRIYEDAPCDSERLASADIVDLTYGSKKEPRDTYGPALKRNAKIFNPYAAQPGEYTTTFDPYAKDERLNKSRAKPMIDETKVQDAVIVEDDSSSSQD